MVLTQLLTLCMALVVAYLLYQLFEEPSTPSPEQPTEPQGPSSKRRPPAKKKAPDPEKIMARARAAARINLMHTIKFKTFMQTPQVESKSVKCLPGIGVVLAEQLEKAGFKTACEVIAKFMKSRADLSKFEEWVHSVCPSASMYHVTALTQTLDLWTANYL